MIDRLVGGRLTDDDREHAATCAWCGQAVARASRFDDDLRRSARRLVVEELPRGILEPGLTPEGFRARRPLPGMAPLVATVAILLLATSVAIWPGGSPPPSPSPSPAGPSKTQGTAGAFKPTALIRVDLTKLDYDCNDGMPLESPDPAPGGVWKEATVCTAPESIGPFMAAAIVGENSRGQVVEVIVKADLNLLGDQNPSTLDQVAMAVAKAASAAPLEPRDGSLISSWVIAHLPAMSPGEVIDVDLAGFHLVIERFYESGGWTFHARPLAVR